MGRKPETEIQKTIIKFLESKGWNCLSFHGSLYQRGIPDLYVTHPEHGARWIEVKLPTRHSNVFEQSQLDTFPMLSAGKNSGYGSGVWVMTSASMMEYKKLFEPPNWWKYLT